MEKNWIVIWVSEVTEKQGRSEQSMSQAAAERLAQQMNTLYPDTRHTAVRLDSQQGRRLQS